MCVLIKGDVCERLEREELIGLSDLLCDLSIVPQYTVLTVYINV